MRAAVRTGRFPLGRVLLHDLALKSAALLAALVLWVLAVQATVERDALRALEGRVPVDRPELAAGLVLRGGAGDVGVRVRAPETVLPRLTPGDFRAAADLTGIDVAAGGVFEVPVRVTAADGRVAVVEVSPPTVSLRIERITARELAVQARFANEPARGWIAGGAALAPREVRLSGPESLVASVAAVAVTVRFGDAPLDVVQTAAPVPVDAAGAVIEGLTVEPATVEVRVPVLPVATTRTVPVVPLLRGTVGAGSWVSRAAVEPVAVTVSGSQQLLAAFDRIETVPIDVSGLTADRAVTVPLVLPPGVTLVRPGDVAVRLTVVPLLGTRPFPLLAVTPANLGAALTATVEPLTAEVTLAGPVAALAAITADQVTATVDLTGLGPGTHQVPVLVRVPPGVTAQPVQPPRATVTMKAK